MKRQSLIAVFLFLLSITTGDLMAIEFSDPKVQKFMEQNLGSPMDKVFHALVPFQFGYENGGAADVYLFKRRDGYISYVTGDLIGESQPPSDAGNYELLAVMRDGEVWGAKLISKLALKNLLTPGKQWILVISAKKLVLMQ